MEKNKVTAGLIMGVIIGFAICSLFFPRVEDKIRVQKVGATVEIEDCLNENGVYTVLKDAWGRTGATCKVPEKLKKY